MRASRIESIGGGSRGAGGITGGGSSRRLPTRTKTTAAKRVRANSASVAKVVGPKQPPSTSPKSVKVKLPAKPKPNPPDEKKISYKAFRSMDRSQNSFVPPEEPFVFSRSHFPGNNKRDFRIRLKQAKEWNKNNPNDQVKPFWNRKIKKNQKNQPFN